MLKAAIVSNGHIDDTHLVGEMIVSMYGERLFFSCRSVQNATFQYGCTTMEMALVDGLPHQGDKGKQHG